MNRIRICCLTTITLLIISTLAAAQNQTNTGTGGAARQQKKASHPAAQTADRVWRFIVSGDSRNCGDVVVPAIAAHAISHFHPAFYWHLGDLRAISKVDEDVAFAENEADGHKVACTDYLKRAWPDYIEHQIKPFGSTPFYVGIGNHEVVPPKGFPSGSPESLQPDVNGAQFTSQFAEWLLAPRIKQQRVLDHDCDAASGNANTKNESCPISPRNYYHWIQGGVDFIYLDNASNIFGDKQMKWLMERIAAARKDPAVHSLVVGMHEALPDSISSDHAMCDDVRTQDPKYPYAQSCTEGRQVYKTLLDFQRDLPDKHVYLLASHSHFFMEGIFNMKPENERLPGWITGTAGAVRYALPKNSSLATTPPQTDVYGYLLGTVDPSGKIHFEFQKVTEADVTSETRRRYRDTFVNWCFQHNSQNRDPAAPETTNRCVPPSAPARAAPPAK